jgi:hypothetical protein
LAGLKIFDLDQGALRHFGAVSHPSYGQRHAGLV